mmetsp:Transcript_35145/g.74781  ORF Transcript_35145/g.74781 Transcript_35145/m.74781 type:complete len:235 (+) Transcript_35145:1316-2020(+)
MLRSSMFQVAQKSEGRKPSKSYSTAFFGTWNWAFSPIFICITAADQTGEVLGSPTAKDIAPSSWSGYTFFSSTASNRTKAMCLFSHLPSIHSGFQAFLPSESTFFFTTSPSARVGRTTSFLTFFGFGGSSFLIIVGSAGRFASLFVSGSSGTPSLASASTMEPSTKLFGSAHSGLISSSSRPSHVSLMSFGGTLMLYFKFSLRWPGVEFGSTGTFTSPLGSTTFSCMVDELQYV